MPNLIRPAPSREAAVFHSSRTAWGIELGPVRLAVTRMREVRGTTPPSRTAAAPARGSFAAGALAGVGGVALLVVGASAAPNPAERDRYMVSVPVPAPVQHVVRPARRATAIGESTPAKIAAALTGERLDAADEPYVARAMATGAFQQWEGADGLPRFLTAGPARFTNAGACRDLALLARLADGGSHVRSLHRCTTGAVSDTAPDGGDAADGSGGADQ